MRGTRAESRTETKLERFCPLQRVEVALKAVGNDVKLVCAGFELVIMLASASRCSHYNGFLFPVVTHAPAGRLTHAQHKVLTNNQMLSADPYNATTVRSFFKLLRCHAPEYHSTLSEVAM